MRINPEAKRIKQELRDVGATSFGMAKFATRALPRVLHEGEHIGGVVYGFYSTGPGILSWDSGMLVATDRRVLFLDRKPGFEARDEITYDIVVGVQKLFAWPFSSLSMHTRLGNYTLKFANRRCIETFMQYVEQRRLESKNGTLRPGPVHKPTLIDQGALAFLNDHETAVLSTVDRFGEAYGAAVHYRMLDDQSLYILTKAETQKVRNIVGHQQVALTLYDRATMQTLQMQGKAELERDQYTNNRVFGSMTHPKVYGGRMAYPPVMSIKQGIYAIIKFTPYTVRLLDFSPSGFAAAGQLYS